MEGEGFNWVLEKEGHCLFIKIRHILRLSNVSTYIYTSNNSVTSGLDHINEVLTSCTGIDLS